VTHRVFLLSPASCAGKRCQMLMARGASFELAQRMQRGGVPIGEVFSFLSALYFRGKLTYARQFAPDDGVLVITSGSGLVRADTAITMRDLRGFARVAIDAAEPRYVEPLRDDARALRARLPRGAELVLLGSIATPKYVDVLIEVFGRELLFPVEFVGRGDMSRGGLLLRAARDGVELDYRPVDGAVRNGPRAVRIDDLPRNRLAAPAK
jgi:hypothetical protein